MSNKVLYATSVACLGFVCFAVGSTAVGLPLWGYYRSLGEFSQIIYHIVVSKADCYNAKIFKNILEGTMVHRHVSNFSSSSIMHFIDKNCSTPLFRSILHFLGIQKYNIYLCIYKPWLISKVQFNDDPLNFLFLIGCRVFALVYSDVSLLLNLYGITSMVSCKPYWVVWTRTRTIYMYGLTPRSFYQLHFSV